MAEPPSARPPEPDRGRRLLLPGAALVALFALGAFVPRNPDVDLLFGVEGYRHLGAGAFAAAAAALLAVLAVPGLAGAIARGLSAGASAIPRFGRFPLLLSAAGAAFFLLTNHTLSGDAGSIVLRLWFHEVQPSNALTNYLFMATSEVGGLYPRDTILTVSCLSGVVYAAAAVGIAREAFADGARRAGTAALLLTAGTVALFFGTLEVYAPLTAGLAIYLYLGLRWLNGRGRWIWPPLCLGVVFWLHMSAGLLLPSLVLLANRGRFLPIRFRSFVGWGLLFLVPVIAVFLALLVLRWGGAVPEAGPGLYGNLMGAGDDPPILPLTADPADPMRMYALLDLEHLAGIVNLLLLAAPAGLALLVAGRRRRRGPAFRFVAVAAVFLVLFVNLWNVSYSLRRDWDLLSGMGVPLALLGALAFFPAARGRGDAVRAGALSLFCFAPFVLGNHLNADRRLEYATVIGEQAWGVVAPSAGIEASRIAAERAREAGVPEPGDREAWRREIEGAATAAILESDALEPFPDSVDADAFGAELYRVFLRSPWPDELRGAAAHWSGLLTEAVSGLLEAGAREDRRPRPGPLAFRAMNVAVERARESGKIAPSGVTPAGEAHLLDALDEAIARQGLFTPRAPAILQDRWATSVGERIGRIPSPGLSGAARRAWTRFVVEAMAEVLDSGGAEERGARWRAAFDISLRWSARQLATMPPGFSAAYERAEALALAGDLDRAEHLVRHNLDRVPGDPANLALLGAILGVLERNDEAREVLAAAIRARPTNMHPRYHLATVLVREGRRDEAIRQLTLGLRAAGRALDPMAPRLLLLLARLRLLDGERAVAKRLCEHAIRRARTTQGVTDVGKTIAIARALIEEIDALR